MYLRPYLVYQCNASLWNNSEKWEGGRKEGKKEGKEGGSQMWTSREEIKITTTYSSHSQSQILVFGRCSLADSGFSQNSIWTSVVYISLWESIVLPLRQCVSNWSAHWSCLVKLFQKYIMDAHPTSRTSKSPILLMMKDSSLKAPKVVYCTAGYDHWFWTSSPPLPPASWNHVCWGWASPHKCQCSWSGFTLNTLIFSFKDLTIRLEL